MTVYSNPYIVYTHSIQACLEAIIKDAGQRLGRRNDCFFGIAWCCISQNPEAESSGTGVGVGKRSGTGTGTERVRGSDEREAGTEGKTETGNCRNKGKRYLVLFSVRIANLFFRFFFNGSSLMLLLLMVPSLKSLV